MNRKLVKILPLVLVLCIMCGCAKDDQHENMPSAVDDIFSHSETITQTEPAPENVTVSDGNQGADQDFLDFDEAVRQRLDEDLNAKPFDFVAEPQVPENAAAEISAQIGTVPVNIRIVGGAGGGKDWNTRTSRANGLPFVPYDGYLAELHKGERVVPAREMQSRNYSSNLYVESMIMNNGTDAEGLAAAMAAAQRRTMSGYGS